MKFHKLQSTKIVLKIKNKKVSLDRHFNRHKLFHFFCECFKSFRIFRFFQILVSCLRRILYQPMIYARSDFFEDFYVDFFRTI